MAFSAPERLPAFASMRLRRSLRPSGKPRRRAILTRTPPSRRRSPLTARARGRDFHAFKHRLSESGELVDDYLFGVVCKMIETRRTFDPE